MIEVLVTSTYNGSVRKVLPKITKTIGRANKLAISLIIVGFLIVMGGESSNRAFAVNLYSDSFPGSYALGHELPQGFANHDCAVTGIIPTFSEWASRYAGPGIGYIDYCAAFTSPEVKGLSVSDKVELYNELTNQRVGLNKAVNLAIYQVLDQQPSSALIFAEQQIQKFKNADTVYAAVDTNISPYFPGTGQEMLNPIQNFWGWAVTLSYSALILITIAVAVMLIFGDRLGGKQRVSLNSAIQGIVLAMILIPLSYPIAGLFIDLTTLGSNAVRGILIGPGGPASGIAQAAVDAGADPDDDKVDDRLCDSFSDVACADGSQQDNPRGLYADDPNINFFNARNKIGFYKINEVIANESICGSQDPGCTDFTASEGLFGFVDGLIRFFFGGGLAAILGSIIFTILNIAMLLVGIRIGIILIKKYLWMLFAPILMPFSFIAMAVPGMGAKVAFGWVKRMAAGAAVFVAAYGMTLFAVVLSSANFMQDIAGGSITYRYVPPLFGGTFLVSTNPEGIVGSPSNATYSILIGLIGMGVYFAIPATLHSIAKKIEPTDSMNIPGVKSAWTEFRSTATPVTRYSGALGLAAARAAGVGPRQFLNREGGVVDSIRSGLNDRIDKLNQLADQETSSGVSRYLAGRASAGLSAAGSTVLSGVAGKSVDVGVPRGQEGGAEFEIELKPDGETADILSGSGESYTILKSAYTSDPTRRNALAALAGPANRDSNGVFRIDLDSDDLRTAAQMPGIVDPLVITLDFELKIKPASGKNSRAGNIYLGKQDDDASVVGLFNNYTGDFGRLKLADGGRDAGNKMTAPSGNPYFTGRDASGGIKLRVKFDTVGQMMQRGVTSFTLTKKIEVYVGPAGGSKDQMTKREISLTINRPSDAFTVF